ncbi:hypothetical protein ACN26Y_29935 [Micromonospora sp. WMMD558]|uniref:hypothetical protein n=1 Tax=Micromonospora sp. WMMD558 TaxID=3403462 RepID=UPI003BF6093F
MSALRAKLAAHCKWANCDDRTAATAPARQGFNDRFLTQAREKYGDLPDTELAIRAESLRKAHFARMAYRSAEVRRGKAAARKAAPDDISSTDQPARTA